MPTAAASSDVRGLLIAGRSHNTNVSARGKIRNCLPDRLRLFGYNEPMARRGSPKSKYGWFLREWMAAMGLDGRGAQAEMMRRTGWSKATMSQLYNGVQDYNPIVLEEAAEALHARNYDLLMHPDEAMALRQFRLSARVIASRDPIQEAEGADVLPDRPSDWRAAS